MNNLACVYLKQSRFDEAEALLLQTIQIGSLAPTSAQGTLAVGNLSRLYERQDRYDEAESLLLEQIEIRKRVLGEADRQALAYMNRLALVYQNQRRYDEAEALHLETLEMRKRILGEGDPDTLGSMHNLAVVYLEQSRFDEAEPLLLQTLEVVRRVLGEEHRRTAMAMSELAWLHEARGRLDLALEIRRELAQRPDASDYDLNGYAWLLLTAEPEALRDPEAALEIALRANEMSGYQQPSHLDTLALAYHRTGDTTKAIETQRKALDLLRAADPDRHEYEDSLAGFQEALEQGTGGGERKGGE